MDKFGETMERITGWWSRSEPRVIFAEIGLGPSIITPPRPYIELLFLVSGELEMRAGRKAKHLKAGDMALINAHQGNSSTPSSRAYVYDCVSFILERERSLADLTRGPLLLVRRMDDTAGVHRLYREVTFLFHSPPPHMPGIQLKAAVLRLLAALYAGGTAGSIPLQDSGNRHVRQALEAIRDRHTDPKFSRHAIAWAAGLSVDHVDRLFKAEFGKSSKRFLNDLRLSRAQYLLRQGTLSVKEVAYATGFCDPLYFSRMFRERIGVPPSKF